MNTGLIYIHLKPNSEVFYVGISKNEKRPYDKFRRNKFWKSIVKKYPDYEVQILSKNLDINFAKELEINLIAYYGRRDLGTGTLVNLTSGGDGVCDYVITEEHRNKLKKNSKIGEISKVKIINIETGIIYQSLIEAYNSEKENLKITHQSLRRCLSGVRNNKTSLRYYK